MSLTRSLPYRNRKRYYCSTCLVREFHGFSSRAPFLQSYDPRPGVLPEPKVFGTDRHGRNLKTSLCLLYSPLGGEFGVHCETDMKRSGQVCPGRHLAEQGLWEVIVSTLATLQIGKATDDSGAEMENCPKFKSGTTMHSGAEMGEG